MATPPRETVLCRHVGLVLKLYQVGRDEWRVVPWLFAHCFVLNRAAWRLPPFWKPCHPESTWLLDSQGIAGRGKPVPHARSLPPGRHGTLSCGTVPPWAACWYQQQCIFIVVSALRPFNNPSTAVPPCLSSCAAFECLAKSCAPVASWDAGGPVRPLPTRHRLLSWPLVHHRSSA